MQIASKVKRQLFIGIVLGATPNFLISAILAVFLKDDYTSFWVSFFICLACIYLIGFAFWLRDTIWEWTFYLLRGKKELVSCFLKHLIEKKYPEPDEYIDSGIEWLTDVAQNKENPSELRVCAAAESGALNATRLNGLWHRFFRASMAIDEAILQYKMTFPAPKEDG